MRIISFTGPKGSGKDTCADILKQEGISQGKISFVGPLRKMASEIWDIDPKMFEDRRLKEADFGCGVLVSTMALVRLFSLMEEYIPMFINVDTTALAMSQPVYYVRTPRELLQYVGTEIIRKQINPAWHIEAAFSPKGLEGFDQEGTYCVTDARFPNEYQWLNNRFMLDFTGFYVERPEAEAALATATHESELAVKDVRKLMLAEMVLDNSGTVEALRKQLLTKI